MFPRFRGHGFRLCCVRPFPKSCGRERTAVINQIRAFLLERGVVFRTGRQHMAREMPMLFTDERSTLSARMRMILQQLWTECRGLDADITVVTKETETIAATDAGCRRLLAIPGVGPLVATALVAAIADGTGFKRGRDLAAWLGLVPRQHSTGGKPMLLGMSKRGNTLDRGRQADSHRDRPSRLERIGDEAQSPLDQPAPATRPPSGST